MCPPKYIYICTHIYMYRPICIYRVTSRENVGLPELFFVGGVRMPYAYLDEQKQKTETWCIRGCTHARTHARTPRTCSLSQECC